MSEGIHEGTSMSTGVETEATPRLQGHDRPDQMTLEVTFHSGPFQVL